MEKHMKSTTPIQDKLEIAFALVAEVLLYKQKKDYLDSNFVAIEAARIERCVEHFYKTEKHDLQYPEYAIQFIQQNCKDIINGKYDGEWLDDIQDIKLVDGE